MGQASMNFVPSLFTRAVILIILGIAFGPPPAGAQSKLASNESMEKVLRSMDAASAKFRTTQADFEWVQWEKVLGEVADTQRGTVYFRRTSGQMEMAAQIADPKPPRFVLFQGGTISLYETGINRVTVHDAAKHREEFETFLVLGFGGSGHDLEKSFDVTYNGTEKLGNVSTEILELVPKSEKIRNNFTRITLWIDPARGVSLQQQLFEASGNYRLQKYANIVINEKIPDGVFKLKTNSKTETITQ